MTEAKIEDRVLPGQIYEIRPDGRWNIFLDASMCGAFGQCPQYFKYNYIDSIAPKGDRPWARDIGSWWSEVMENIYSAFYKGEKLSSQQVVELAISKWNSLKMDDLAQFHPKTYKEFGGVHGAVLMITEYADRQLPIDYQCWRIIAAEASFGRNREVVIGETGKVVLHWMGQPDLYVIFNDRIMPVDHKSLDAIGSNTPLRYKPHIQLPGYIIAGQILLKQLGFNLPVDRCIINAVARKEVKGSKTDVAPRFKRFFISYTEAELSEWKVRRLRQAEHIRECIETSIWPWQEYACSNMWNRPCPFQRIDDKPPDSRSIVIAADFVKKDFWIPGGKEPETKAEVKG